MCPHFVEPSDRNLLNFPFVGGLLVLCRECPILVGLVILGDFLLCFSKNAVVRDIGCD